MTSLSSVTYLHTQLVNHTRLFFEPPATELLRSDTLQFLPMTQAVEVRRPSVVIPTDIPLPESPQSPWQAEFNGTRVTLYNRTPGPDTEWVAVPSENAPVWYQHSSGTVIPAWNLFGNAFDLLTFGEERRILTRDKHGRFVAAYSPRKSIGLLDIPVVNETVALLVAAAHGLSRDAKPAFTLDNLLMPPVVVLSHDCDILLGNDFWTQAVRLFRVPLPLARLRMPRFSNLWWAARNAANPRRFYFDNATGMADLERCFGYRSTYYMLNGNSGRFGSRSPFRIIPELIGRLPSGWDVGIHYNYDTFLDEQRFSAQLAQLQQAAPRRIVAGRAHYLRFDPFRSYQFMQRFGIRVDESSGYPDYVGYRNGIAGCFQAYSHEAGSAPDVWEIPLVFMEAALVAQYGAKAVDVVKQHLAHVSKIGGALTILVHPGQFNNPENKLMLGIYHELLKACRDVGARSETARSLVEHLNP